MNNRRAPTSEEINLEISRLMKEIHAHEDRIKLLERYHGNTGEHLFRVDFEEESYHNGSYYMTHRDVWAESLEEVKKRYRNYSQVKIKLLRNNPIFYIDEAGKFVEE